MYYIIYPAASPSIGRRDFLGFSTNVVYSFLLLWQRLIKGSVACVRLNELGKQVKTTEIKVFAGKLGRETDIWWILTNSGRHGNWRISGLAIYLKMFVIMPAITMPSFMLVSKSAQFAWNFELCRRTITPDPEFPVGDSRHRTLKRFVASYLCYFAEAIVEAWSLKIACYFYTDISADSNGILVENEKNFCHVCRDESWHRSQCRNIEIL